MIKKILSAFIMTALCISITACSQTVTDNNDNTSSAQSSPTELTEAGETKEETTSHTSAESEETTDETEAADTVSDSEKTTVPEQTHAQTTTPAPTAEATQAPVPEWTETAVSGTMYVNTEGVYSRKYAIQGSEKVSRYSLNQAVTVVAKTNTNYYKLDNGTFIHADYLSPQKTVITAAPTTTTTKTPPSTTTPPTTTPAPSTTTAASQNPLTPSEFAQRVFELTNQERIKNGKAPFEKMTVLDEIAMTRAAEIAQKYGHDRPDGRSFSTAFNDKGIIYGYFGENIAAGQTTPEAVVSAWMNSPSHRANILSDTYTYLGVGYVYDKGNYQNMDYFWVQNFYAYS